jgi:hypothetical protein
MVFSSVTSFNCVIVQLSSSTFCAIRNDSLTVAGSINSKVLLLLTCAGISGGGAAKGLTTCWRSLAQLLLRAECDAASSTAGDIKKSHPCIRYLMEGKERKKQQLVSPSYFEAILKTQQIL